MSDEARYQASYARDFYEDFLDYANGDVNKANGLLLAAILMKMNKGGY